MASKTIQIGNREVEMLAVSSCNFYYRRLFGEDPFELQALAASREGGSAMGITFAMQMGFVMMKAAEAHGDRNIMNALTLDVRGGETFRIPDTGLDALDLSGNMALPMIPEAIEVISRKSRPKPVSEQE